MPENWKTYKLGEVAALRKKTLRPKDFNGEKYIGLEHIGQGDFLLNGIGIASDVTSNKFKFKSGDILYGKIRPYFKKVYKPQFSGICSTDILIIKSSSEEVVTQEYLYQLIKTQAFTDKAVETSSGTKMPRADWNSLEQVEYTFPPLQEQKSIASILSALDDKIELNLQMNNTLEEMAMALYKHWFVDFGPFQDGEFVASELGEIPKGWEVKKLGELFKLKHGFAFKGKHFQLEERDELLLTPGNFQSSGGIKFNWGKQKFYSGDFPNDYILTKGDLVIALTDLTQSCEILGAPAIIPDNDYKYLHNQRLGLVTDLSPQFSNEFIYCTANSRDFRSFIRNSKTGSTVSHTSPTRIYDYKIALPPQGLEINFMEELKNLLELTFTNSSENKTLTQLRDTLLPKLISGEVRVKDAEKTLSEVL